MVEDRSLAVESCPQTGHLPETVFCIAANDRFEGPQRSIGDDYERQQWAEAV